MALFCAAKGESIVRGTVIMDLNLKYLMFRKDYAMSILRFADYYLKQQRFIRDMNETHLGICEVTEMAGNTIKLLVVEDDFALNDTVRETISELGEVTQVHDGDEGWFEIESGVYDAVVLDVMLPGQDGFTILKKAKDMFPNLPILMLTAKGELSDKIQGFNLGADEYITKPFYKEELLARLKTLLRHTGVLGQDGALEVGNVQVFIDQHRVLVNDQEVNLQGREFGLLVYLMQHVGQIVTKDQIFDRLWGFDSDTSLTVVEVYMSNLRKNLRNADAQVTIKTLRNVGYTLNETLTED